MHARTRYGSSALTLAAKGGHLQTVRLLIELGLDPNGLMAGGDGCEFLPMLAAAQCGHDAVLRVLLDRGWYYLHILLGIINLEYKICS